MGSGVSADTRTVSDVSVGTRKHALQVRVREAVHTCTARGTSMDYVKAMQRMRMAGVPVGSKDDHHAFMEAVEHAAVVCARRLTASILGRLVPAL